MITIKKCVLVVMRNRYRMVNMIADVVVHRRVYIIFIDAIRQTFQIARKARNIIAN